MQKEKMLSLGKVPTKLLSRLIQQLPTDNKDMVVPPGLGRDAAGISINGQLVAVTTDPITFATNHIATYCVAANINDIACLGAKPRWFTANFLLPEHTSEHQLEELWRELTEQLKRYNITAIGGHTEVTTAVNTPILVGQMIGYAMNTSLLNPGNASIGDRVLLWRKVAIEGTALLAFEKYNELLNHFDEATLLNMQKLLYDPGICVWPLVEKLVPTTGLVALHDPTDGGLATALHELAEAAGTGVLVNAEQIHYLPETEKLARLFNIDPLGLLASGSLLIVCRPDAEQAILEKLRGEDIISIGELTSSPNVLIQQGDRIEQLPRYDKDEIIKALNKQL